ncbi:DUF58 domain-containing protein [Paraflavisolibacter sp. H34]|uniref:DUF58 domain-containing protein n=1 Tax=Huijunlia imazamoxiresistens TaxID=3127457 RepID=UPI003016B16E
MKEWMERSSFYLKRKVYYAGFLAALLFALSYFFPPLFDLALAVLVFAGLAVLIDVGLLYGRRSAVSAERVLEDRMSNGDDNRVVLRLANRYGFKVHLRILDELPFQFQERHWRREVEVPAGGSYTLEYMVKPLQRGEYRFGNINLYATSPLRLVKRRYTVDQPQAVKVYPSYIQMRRYQLLAATSHLQETGSLPLRKLGQSMEFEQIKEYVRGDDYRTINWKASARRGDLMVNNFTDERSQQVYCIINKGRMMKMPFGGMTLLDYAINAALVLCNTALMKQDKAGLITLAQNIDTFLPADKKPTQMNALLQALYKQQTDFKEPDLEKLFSAIRTRISQRSLLVLFTNYESVESLERDLPSLKRIAHYHLLVVVFFENTELQQLVETPVNSIEDIYIRTIAEKYQFDKKLIARELQKHGILSVLSQPQKLTIHALNKYLEVKNRQSL